MIEGMDISKWNGENAVRDILTKKPDMRFVVIKATEGRTYKDPMLEKHYSAAIENRLMVGFYHYARPDNGNTPEAEAENFLSTVTELAKVGSFFMVLDYEGKSLNYGQAWALSWLNYVYRKTCVKPLIYLQASATKDYKMVYDFDYGLWVAAWCSYEKMKSYLKHWPVWAIWQFSADPFDKNRFNGTEDQLKLYMKSDNENEEGHCTCGCCYKS